MRFKVVLFTAVLVTSLFVATSAQAPSDPKLDADSQAKLKVAFDNWQKALEAAEVAKLSFNATMYQVMAEAKVSPKEYQLSIEKGAFVLTKVEVAKAPEVQKAPANKPKE